MVKIVASSVPKCFRSDLGQDCKTATPTRARVCPEAIVLCTLLYILGHCPAAATNCFHTKPVQLVGGSLAECEQTLPLSDFLLNMHSGMVPHDDTPPHT